MVIQIARPLSIEFGILEVVIGGKDPGRRFVVGRQGKKMIPTPLLSLLAFKLEP